MAKLSGAMVKGLRSVERGADCMVPARTINALQSRFLIAGSEDNGYKVTPSGRDILARLDREAAQAKADAERASRPVPAGAFVEPSAKSAPVTPVEYEDDAEDEAMSADKPTIRTRADLDLWLDGWDAGTAATLRTLAAIPADMLPAVVARWTADHTRSGAVAGAAPTRTR